MAVYGYDPNKTFPILGGKSVLWEDAETAYETYHKHFPGESLEQLAKGGGFSPEEFAYSFSRMYPQVGKWALAHCVNCCGVGDIVDHEEGAIVIKCGICFGVGAVPAPDGVAKVT